MSQSSVAGFQPLPNAVTYVNGFNVEPGWRSASATLTCPSMAGSSNLTEPSIAMISPVVGWMATNAALVALRAFRSAMWSVADFSAWCCRSRSRLVVIWSPSRKSASVPNCWSMSWRT